MSVAVLLIDDDPRIRASLGRLLRVLSYEVLEAATLEAALELAVRTPPDVVITDLHMPERSGVDVARRLQSHPQLNHIPVIALTASPPRDQETISLFHAILEKPCTAEDLTNALAAALQIPRH